MCEKGSFHVLGRESFQEGLLLTCLGPEVCHMSSPKPVSSKASAVTMISCKAS